MTGYAVDITLDLAAPIRRVWDAISTTDGLCRWLAPVVSIDEKALSVAWEGGEPSVLPITGRDERRRLAVGEASIALQPRGTHTTLHFVQPTDETGRPALQSGWTFFLGNLRHYVERRPGEACRWLERAIPRLEDAEECWARLKVGIELRQGQVVFTEPALIGRRDALHVPWLLGAAMFDDDVLCRISLNYSGGPPRAHLVLLGYRGEASRLELIAEELLRWLERLLATPAPKE